METERSRRTTQQCSAGPTTGSWQPVAGLVKPKELDYWRHPVNHHGSTYCKQQRPSNDHSDAVALRAVKNCSAALADEDASRQRALGSSGAHAHASRCIQATSHRWPARAADGAESAQTHTLAKNPPRPPTAKTRAGKKSAAIRRPKKPSQYHRSSSTCPSAASRRGASR